MLPLCVFYHFRGWLVVKVGAVVPSHIVSVKINKICRIDQLHFKTFQGDIREI